MLPAAISCSSGFHRWVRAFVDKRHVGPFATAQLVAEPGRELQPAGAAADDDDVMRIGRFAHHGFRCGASLDHGYDQPRLVGFADVQCLSASSQWMAKATTRLRSNQLAGHRLSPVQK